MTTSTEIENDDFYKDFINNSKPADSSALFYSDQIHQKLGEGLELITNELKSQVRDQHGSLLSQALHAGRLDNSLNCVDSHMMQLVERTNRLSAQVNQPYAELEHQTKVLRRLHEVSHVMRQAGSFLQLYKKLTQTKEFHKQAMIFKEIDTLTEDHSLNQLKFIKDEIASVQAAKNKLIQMADKELVQGLKTQKEESVLQAIEILSNLGILERFFMDMVETYILDVKQSIKECFTSPDSKINPNTVSLLADSQKSGRPKGPGKAPTLTTNLHFRNKLWLALEWLFTEEITDYSQQITFLQKCLKNSAVVTVEFDMESKWWTQLENLLNESFSTCPTHILQCLQQLPKLIAITKNMIQKLNIQRNVFSPKLYQSLEPGFIEKCAATLKASLVVVSDIPTEDDINNFVRLAGTELSAAIVDDRLSEMVINVIMSCNKDLWNRLESLIKLGTDARQIFDVPNGSQIQNTMIANLIHHHANGVKQLVQDLSSKQREKSFEGLLSNLNIGHNLELAILQQLIDAMTSSVSDILVSIHREPGLNTNQSSMYSLYIKELQDFVARAWTSHIVPFSNRELVGECGKNLAIRCIELFVRNVAILRPLTAIGRNKLKVDCQQLEVALKPIVPDLGTIGKSFRMLRAFHSLLGMTVNQLAEQHLEPDNPVPTYIILLMMFSFAGTDLLSPHSTANWTIEKLQSWLDGHTSDRERFELISGALLKYRNDIRKKNLTQYDPVYPIISASLEKAHSTRK